ncbi:hypothetical protein F0562_022580 [Nyssa sinensis]|uniref:Uncharacterized protein n=1 Tax=Nyssa sinensis TaxID=561372 RepID=A0A5J5BTI3_9ASTE|nr:hypothetical protein F0562_022580 [Nyssa sinensis]
MEELRQSRLDLLIQLYPCLEVWSETGHCKGLANLRFLTCNCERQTLWNLRLLRAKSGTPVQLDSSDAAATENDQAECSCIGSGCYSVCQVFDNQENQIRQIEPRPGVYFLEVLKDGKALDQINLVKDDYEKLPRCLWIGHSC